MSVWKKNKIPPLYYCSIKRASQLLSCYEDDIFHWIDNGMIEPCFKVNNLYGNVFTTVKKFDEIRDDINNNATLYNLILKASPMGGGLDILAPPIIRPLYSGSIQVNCKCKISGIVSVLDIDDTDNSSWDRFQIKSRDMLRLLLPQYIRDFEYAYLDIFQGSATISKNELLLTKEAIENIYKHSISGIDLDFPYYDELDDGEEKSNKNKHYTKIKMMQNQEVIFMAVCRCLFHYPEIAKEARVGEKIIRSKLANLLLDRGHLLFDTKESPIKDLGTLDEHIKKALSRIGLT